MKRVRQQLQDSFEKNQSMTKFTNQSSSEARKCRRKSRNPLPVVEKGDNDVYCIFPTHAEARNAVTIYRFDIKRLPPGSSQF